MSRWEGTLKESLLTINDVLNLLQNGSGRCGERHLPQTSSHSGKIHGLAIYIPLTAHPCPDLTATANLAYDYAPNFKEGMFSLVLVCNVK